jgi:hypothetical protein
MQKVEQITEDSESSTSGSSSVHRTSSSQQKQLSFDLKYGRRRSVTGRKGEELSPLAVRSFPESTQAGDLFSATAKGCRPPLVRKPAVYGFLSVLLTHPSLSFFILSFIYISQLLSLHYIVMAISPV